ncbi:DUF3870 domain-containing protein [Cupriavidus basilensis]|uniref:DUF3870 domain-containing protein n=1 Tax=Cupriavidus basilensis TaxID=68895 RepID=A0ABT6ANB6_9BURK|nr:DUF3870 domain-containing protein [Cupriavidus basilensis]MDF3833802.1 DUF3870 domain-containing protein [Cupriavidus basilensis]
MTKPLTLLIAGHARLPQGMPAKQVFDSLTITVEIDARYAVVIDASCTLVTEHGRRFIRDLLRGRSLRDGIGEMTGLIQQCYVGRASPALAAALKDLHQQYEKLQPGREPRPLAPNPL